MGLLKQLGLPLPPQIQDQAPQVGGLPPIPQGNPLGASPMQAPPQAISGVNSPPINQVMQALQGGGQAYSPQGGPAQQVPGGQNPWQQRHPNIAATIQGFADAYLARRNPEFFRSQQENLRQANQQNLYLMQQKAAEARQSTEDLQRKTAQEAAEKAKYNDLAIQAIMKGEWQPAPPTTPGKTPPANAITIGDYTLIPGLPKDNESKLSVVNQDTLLGRAYKKYLGGQQPDSSGNYKLLPDELTAIRGLQEMEQKRDDKDAIGDALNLYAKVDHAQIDKNIQDPDQRAMWHSLLDAAILTDKKTGGTTQYDKYSNLLRTEIDKPAALAEKEAERIRMLNLTRQITQGPSPSKEAITRAADAVLMNADNEDYITKLSAGDKQFERTLRDELISRQVDGGIGIDKLGAQAKESKTYAKVASALLEPMMAKVEMLGKLGQLGPWAGRVNAFMQGKVGKEDPDYSQLAGEVDLMRKLIAKIHLGVRGAGSPQNAEAMKQKVDENKMDAPTLIAGLKAYQTFVNYYRTMGERTREEVQGNPNPQGAKPKIVVPPPGS